MKARGNEQAGCQTLTISMLEDVLYQLQEVWINSTVSLPSGEFGWYRKLDNRTRLGNVATAQGILANPAFCLHPERRGKLISSLLRRRRDDGSWAFVSTLNSIGVIDATAWVVLALASLQVTTEPDLGLESSIILATDWLIGKAQAHGGWNLGGDAEPRIYSTALVLRALYATKRQECAAFQSSIRFLLSKQDQATGAWKDTSGSLSISVTAFVIVTLSMIAGKEQSYQSSRHRATDWLLNIAKESNDWSEGPYAKSVEEVEVHTQAGLSRIEFGTSPRSLALHAATLERTINCPEVVRVALMVTTAAAEEDWRKATGNGSSSLASWMLYDVQMALRSVQRVFDGSNLVAWTDGHRSVLSRSSDSRMLVLVRRHPKTVAGIFLLIFSLLCFPVLGFGAFALLLPVVGGIAQNIISSWIYDHWKANRGNK